MAGALAQNIETILIVRFLAGTFGSAPLVNSGAQISDMWAAYVFRAFYFRQELTKFTATSARLPPRSLRSHPSLVLSLALSSVSRGILSL